MASCLIKGENGWETGADAQRRGDTTKLWHGPRQCAGAISLRTLDQEAAVGPEQGHTRSTHRRGGCNGRDLFGRRPNKRFEKLHPGSPGKLRPARSRMGEKGARLRGKQ